MLARSCISVSTIRLKCGGRLRGPISGPAFRSIIWPRFRFHRNDNEQSRYHCDETGSGARIWTPKLGAHGQAPWQALPWHCGAQRSERILCLLYLYSSSCLGHCAPRVTWLSTLRQHINQNSPTSGPVGEPTVREPPASKEARVSN